MSITETQEGGIRFEKFREFINWVSSGIVERRLTFLQTNSLLDEQFLMLAGEFQRRFLQCNSRSWHVLFVFGFSVWTLRLYRGNLAFRAAMVLMKSHFPSWLQPSLPCHSKEFAWGEEICLPQMTSQTIFSVSWIRPIPSSYPVRLFFMNFISTSYPSNE